jgi:hypothetical protein
MGRPGELIVLDLAPPQSRAAGAAIVAGYERYDPARYGEAVTSLDVSWNAATCPPGWHTAGGGVVYVRMPDAYDGRLPEPHQLPLQPTDDGWYSYEYVHDADRIVIIVILPAGYAVRDRDPAPLVVKAWRDRVALIWEFRDDPIKVQWRLGPAVADVAASARAAHTDLLWERRSAGSTVWDWFTHHFPQTASMALVLPPLCVGLLAVGAAFRAADKASTVGAVCWWLGIVLAALLLLLFAADAISAVARLRCVQGILHAVTSPLRRVARRGVPGPDVPGHSRAEHE